MLTILIIVALSVLAYIIAAQIMKSGKVEKSINLDDVLMSKEDIHTEIAKTVEEIKTQDPVVVEVPFVAEKVKEDKPKKKPAPKKPAAPKTKATPKKSK